MFFKGRQVRSLGGTFDFLRFKMTTTIVPSFAFALCIETLWSLQLVYTTSINATYFNDYILKETRSGMESEL